MELFDRSGNKLFIVKIIDQSRSKDRIEEFLCNRPISETEIEIAIKEYDNSREQYYKDNADGDDGTDEYYDPPDFTKYIIERFNLISFEYNIDKYIKSGRY